MTVVWLPFKPHSPPSGACVHYANDRRESQSRRLSRLSAELGLNLVAYVPIRSRRTTVAKRHLCHCVAPARPTQRALGSIAKLERRLGLNIVIVAYRRPWQRVGCRPSSDHTDTVKLRDRYCPLHLSHGRGRNVSAFRVRG